MLDGSLRIHCRVLLLMVLLRTNATLSPPVATTLGIASEKIQQHQHLAMDSNTATQPGTGHNFCTSERCWKFHNLSISVIW